ncbi:uncharacterized protein LOC122983371 isoform X1 [Thunnus albacares]|uniref:uncharacterized protein LOC122983371 isoform X1 n=1 Tax=Thunnus albacares TaxID=8236 RepID=UPI001CF62804|nr:uncharacterized protein LOC122983371 isoform X1 [Thunnus albacares]
MGNRQSTKKKQQDKHQSNMDTKEAADKRETDQSSFAKLPTPTSPDDLNHGESKDLTGNLNETATTSQGLGPTKLDVPQNREQSIPTTGNISQDADLVKSTPYHARVTKLYICLDKPDDPKTNIPKPRLQQATPARPAVEPRHGAETSAGDFDALMSDVLQKLKDAPETSSQQQSTSTALVQQMTKPVRPQKKTTAPLQQQTYRQVTYGHTLYEESESLTPSEQETTKETTEGLIQKSQKQNTSTKPGVAQVPASTPTELPNNSTQMSNQPRTQVNNEENALQEPGLNHNNVTNVISVNYQYCFSAKSESSRANAAKLRLRQKLANKLKAQPQDGSNNSQQTAEETVTVQESSQQQGCTAMRAKKHKKLHQIPQHNKADYDTSGNPSSCIHKVSVNPPEPQVPVVEQRPAAAPNITATHHPTTAAADANVKLRHQCKLKVSVPQDTAVRPRRKCTFIALNQNQPKEEKLNGNNGHVGEERPEPAFSPAPGPEHSFHAEGRWHPFTVNQSCSHKARCHHNPGKGLPPNVQKFDECPNYLREPPRVTTAKLAACLPLREAQEEGGDSHQ